MVTTPGFENGGITPEAIDRMHHDVAAFVRKQLDAGALPDEMANIGYPRIPEKSESVHLTIEELAETEAAIMSGEILVRHETVGADEDKKPSQNPPQQAPQPKRKAKPPARTSKQKLARDSGHDRKPFPYGSMED